MDKFHLYNKRLYTIGNYWNNFPLTLNKYIFIIVIITDKEVYNASSTLQQTEGSN